MQSMTVLTILLKDFQQVFAKFSAYVKVRLPVCNDKATRIASNLLLILSFALSLISLVGELCWHIT